MPPRSRCRLRVVNDQFRRISKMTRFYNPGNITGCGKTWLACALGNQACRQGMSVLYVRTSRLLEEMNWRTLTVATANG